LLSDKDQQNTHNKSKMADSLYIGKSKNLKLSHLSNDLADCRELFETATDTISEEANVG